MTSKQAQAFMGGDGDAWHNRNRDKSRYPDPVAKAIEWCGLRPKRVLEIGCGNGWRLRDLYQKYGSCGWGIDPSRDAIQEARALSQGDSFIYYTYGTALDIKARVHWFDMIIFGFCLYLADREDLFRIVAETNRVLADGGYLIIHDFDDGPFSRVYEHNPKLRSYHMDHAKLFLANPIYKPVRGEMLRDHVAVWVLKKDTKGAFPSEDK